MPLYTAGTPQTIHQKFSKELMTIIWDFLLIKTCVIHCGMSDDDVTDVV